MKRFLAVAAALPFLIAGCSEGASEPDLPTAEGASQFCQKQLTREISTVQTLRFENEEVEERSPLNDRWNWVVQGTLVADKDGTVAHYACLVTAKGGKNGPVYAATLSINTAEDQDPSSTHTDMEFRTAALAAQEQWVELVGAADAEADTGGNEDTGDDISPQLGANLPQSERDQFAQEMIEGTSSFAVTSTEDVEQTLSSICEVLPKFDDPAALMMNLYSPAQGDTVTDVATLVTAAIGAQCPEFWVTFP